MCPASSVKSARAVGGGAEPCHADVRLRIRHGEDVAMGPGKADLLEAIAATGSISAAARSMGMSYRRAWMLVETMNRCFPGPLVRAKTGGQSGGGAEVTPLGLKAVKRYRALQQAVDRTMRPHVRALGGLMKKSGAAGR